VATGAGAHALKFPASGQGRRRVRDARLVRWEVTALDVGAAPPTATVGVRVKAAAWADGDVHEGDDRRPRNLDLVWTLELDETTHAQPRWRLTNSAAAA
jgi:predicted lipid-binding transport protein (Tim44 family)